VGTSRRVQAGLEPFLESGRFRAVYLVPSLRELVKSALAPQAVSGDSRLAWDSNRGSAASTARCAHDLVVGPGDGDFMTKHQDLRVLHMELRVSSPSQATSVGRSDREVEPPRPAILRDGHV